MATLIYINEEKDELCFVKEGKSHHMPLWYCRGRSTRKSRRELLKAAKTGGLAGLFGVDLSTYKRIFHEQYLKGEF